MRQRNKPPIRGQFVAIWIYEDRIWSETFHLKDTGKLLRYATEGDQFTEYDVTLPSDIVGATNVKYIYED